MPPWECRKGQRASSTAASAPAAVSPTADPIIGNRRSKVNHWPGCPDYDKVSTQIEAFEDTWHWHKTAEWAFDEVVHSGNTDAAEMLRAMCAFLKENDVMALYNGTLTWHFI